MTISVLVPTYNAARTIEATLTSVFRQTVQPDEIIVLWDGGTDDTLDRIERFNDRITIVRQENHGVAFTRNRLVEMAKGEILAFLDNDDLWHPKYLEVQRTLMREYPEALASVSNHVDFTGADYVWNKEPDTDRANAEWINQVDFFKRYNVTTGLFGSMSFACVRKSAMNRLGPEPFQFSGVDDSYLFYQVSLLGGIVFFKSPLVAYRMSEGSFSANPFQMLSQWMKAFEKLEPAFQKCGIRGLRKAFPAAYAVKRRRYAKALLSAGRAEEARYQLLRSIANCRQPSSVGKSLTIWAASWLPSFLQPRWPSSARNTAKFAGSLQTSSPAVGRGKA
ncbi:MAG: glycosyltransferase family 2 protein [Verrucomicrobiota bacterium]|jgi:glycosyltransferase involved in cell wall biosynthesis